MSSAAFTEWHALLSAGGLVCAVRLLAGLLPQLATLEGGQSLPQVLHLLLKHLLRLLLLLLGVLGGVGLLRLAADLLPRRSLVAQRGRAAEVVAEEGEGDRLQMPGQLLAREGTEPVRKDRAVERRACQDFQRVRGRRARPRRGQIFRGGLARRGFPSFRLERAPPTKRPRRGAAAAGPPFAPSRSSAQGQPTRRGAFSGPLILPTRRQRLYKYSRSSGVVQGCTGAPFCESWPKPGRRFTQ